MMVRGGKFAVDPFGQGNGATIRQRNALYFAFEHSNLLPKLSVHVLPYRQTERKKIAL
jgi:hypothetical protein